MARKKSMSGGPARARPRKAPPASPAIIEQPTVIRTRSLDPRDQDDRVRAVFGLTGDDPLPEVGERTLCRYHRHLAKLQVAVVLNPSGPGRTRTFNHRMMELLR